jgi:hypothetical protein
MSGNRKNEEDTETKPTFDIYGLFSRWDFVLLVLFVLATLIMTILILLAPQPV